jgi:hypothetical protein
VGLADFDRRDCISPGTLARFIRRLEPLALLRYAQAIRKIPDADAPSRLAIASLRRRRVGRERGGESGFSVSTWTSGSDGGHRTGGLVPDPKPRDERALKAKASPREMKQFSGAGVLESAVRPETPSSAAPAVRRLMRSMEKPRPEILARSEPSSRRTRRA